VALLVILRKRLGGLEGGQILRTGTQALIASAVMGLSLLGWNFLFVERSKYLVLTGGVTLGLFVYAVMLGLLKVPELRSILKKLKAKLAEIKAELK